MTAYIGIDPGQTGGLALVSARGELVDVQRMPVIDTEVSGLLLAALLHDWQDMMGDAVKVIIEQVGSMPGQGVSSTFKFGKNFGVALGVVQAIGFPMERVRPQQWKPTFTLIGKDKDASRGKATELWPSMANRWKLKGDNGLTDAALLAEHGRRASL